MMSPSSPRGPLREPRGKTGAPSGLFGKFITQLNASGSERGDIRSFPHFCIADAVPINVLKSLGLQSFNLLILLVGQHGMVHHTTIVNNRADHSLVDGGELGLREASHAQVP